MVGYLYEGDRRALRPRACPRTVGGLSLAAVAIPTGDRVRSLTRAGRALTRQGVRRCLVPLDFAGWEVLSHGGLAPVDPLPLCRAKAADLALFALAAVPLRRRCLALRGGEAGGGARILAHALCPQVGALLLDFDRGEEDLAAQLRASYGLPPLHLGHGPTPQLSIELAPRPHPWGPTLRLWGQPDLAGLTLTVPGLPAQVEPLPFLTLLWECGRVRPAEIQVVNALDIRAENPYNTGYCDKSIVCPSGTKTGQKGLFS